MYFDPFLYLALALGFVLGRRFHRPNVWTPRATTATVLVLILLLGALLGITPLPAVATVIPMAVGFALLTILLTVAVVLLLPRKPGDPHRAPVPPASPVPMGAIYLAALLVGFIAGHAGWVPPPSWLTYALYLLVGLVGFELQLRLSPLRTIWVPLLASLLGGFGSALAFLFVVGIPARTALATSAAFGWYSLAGPVVTLQVGATAGLLAFLTNFLRENLTMILAPSLGKRLRGEGLTALGGATAMDTTLYFVVRYGDPEAGSLALASGLVLTIAASVLVPFFAG